MMGLSMKMRAAKEWAQSHPLVGRSAARGLEEKQNVMKYIEAIESSSAPSS